MTGRASRHPPYDVSAATPDHMSASESDMAFSVSPSAPVDGGPRGDAPGRVHHIRRR